MFIFFSRRIFCATRTISTAYIKSMQQPDGSSHFCKFITFLMKTNIKKLKAEKFLCENSATHISSDRGLARNKK